MCCIFIPPCDLLYLVLAYCGSHLDKHEWTKHTDGWVTTSPVRFYKNYKIWHTNTLKLNLVFSYMCVYRFLKRCCTFSLFAPFFLCLCISTAIHVGNCRNIKQNCCNYYIFRILPSMHLILKFQVLNLRPWKQLISSHLIFIWRKNR